MKFALLALLAGSTQAILMKDEQCIPLKESDSIFHRIDTNHNHKLSGRELMTAIDMWAKDTHRTLTAENIHWIVDHANKDAASNGKPRSMDEKEFNLFIN